MPWINHWMWWDHFNIQETSEMLYSHFKEYNCDVQVIHHNKKKQLEKNTFWHKTFNFFYCVNLDTGLRPCLSAASHTRSILLTSKAPTSWWSQPSRLCTTPPAWQAWTTPLSIVYCMHLCVRLNCEQILWLINRKWKKMR